MTNFLTPFASLAGKVAVVTGGTQGLGAAVAMLLAQRGASGIVICGRNDTKGKAHASDIETATDTQCNYVQADLALVEDCRKVIAQADRAFGKVDVLVNAAAITDRGNILETDPALFDRMFAINVRAPFFLMQETVKVMRRERIEGAIVNIGWMASEGEDRMQREFHQADADWLDHAAARQPFGRLVDPQEVARAVAYLCSAESGLMTGSVVEFDQSVWGAYDGSPHPDAPL